jgi:hypothetical protein
MLGRDGRAIACDANATNESILRREVFPADAKHFFLR